MYKKFIFFKRRLDIIIGLLFTIYWLMYLSTIDGKFRDLMTNLFTNITITNKMPISTIKNYDKNIVIILSDYHNRKHNTYPDGLYLSNTFKTNIKEDNFKIINLNYQTKHFFFKYQSIVQPIDYSIKKKNRDNNFYYFTNTIRQIVKDNPKANIILTLDTINKTIRDDAIELLNSIDNLNIGINLNFYTFDNRLVNHKRLTYFGECYNINNFNNLKCINNSFINTPIKTYELYKKDFKHDGV